MICLLFFCFLVAPPGLMPPGAVPDGAGGFVPFTNSRVAPDGSLRPYDPNLDGILLEDGRVIFPAPFEADQGFSNRLQSFPRLARNGLARRVKRSRSGANRHPFIVIPGASRSPPKRPRHHAMTGTERRLSRTPKVARRTRQPRLNDWWMHFSP
jgi:hypothetical protein